MLFGVQSRVVSKGASVIKLKLASESAFIIYISWKNNQYKVNNVKFFMPEKPKTTLRKKFLKFGGNDPVEKIAYCVISSDPRANILEGLKDCFSYIYAKKFEKGDYLIMRKVPYDKVIPLEIVNNRHNLDTVLSRLYENALETANWRAEMDHNEVLDLTGNVPIPEK